MNALVNNVKRQWQRSSRAAGVLILALTLSGCYLPAAVRDYQAGRDTPWWCQGTPDLTQNECFTFSAYLDTAVDFSYGYPTLGEFVAAGAVAAPSFTHEGMGKPYIIGSTAVFDPAQPNVLFYVDDSAGARAAAVGWAVDDVGTGAPAGFAGDRETWLLEGGKYYQPLWGLRGYENHPDVFATAHPCLLGPGGSSLLTSTSDACFVASHTEPLKVLVTNDDGVMAPGMDALVEGLFTLNNVSVQIVAPAANQSGSSDQVTEAPFVTSAAASTTLSGRAATAIESSDPNPPRNGSGSPADSVIYAIETLLLSPDIVLSGTNKGQNIGPLSAVSGTVGAARTAARRGLDAIATSTGGIVLAADFPTGAAATLSLLEQWRLGNAGKPYAQVLSINVPTCASGFSVRGTIETVVAQSADGRPLFGQSAQDCSSTETQVNDDVDAFNFGFISITDIGRFSPPNWN